MAHSGEPRQHGRGANAGSATTGSQLDVACSYTASAATGPLEERLWSASCGQHLLIDNLEACALPTAGWASDGAVVTVSSLVLALAR